MLLALIGMYLFASLSFECFYENVTRYCAEVLVQSIQ